MTKFAVALLATGLYAQQEAIRPPHGTISASGEATVTAAPDEARINVGVVTQAKSAEEAAAENARQADSVISRLRALVGSSSEVKTINYSVSPNYDYHAKATPTITGYTAENTVQVRIENLKNTGKIIDAVTATGANAINGIQFTLKDDHAVRAEALRQAAARARTNAEAIAAALGLQVTGVFSAEAGEPVPPRPMMMMAMQVPGAAPAPISPGVIDVRAVVTVTLEVRP